MMLRYVKKIEAQSQKWFSYQKKNCKEKNNKNRFGKYCLMTGGRIFVSLKDSRPLLYKCSLNEYHNAKCGYYVIYYFWNTNFYWMLQGMGIVFFACESFHLNFFLLSTKIINQRTYLRKKRMFWHFCVSHSSSFSKWSSF